MLHKTKACFYTATRRPPATASTSTSATRSTCCAGSAWEPIEKLFLLIWIFRSTGRYLAFNRFRPANVVAVLRGLKDGVLGEPSGPTAVLSRSG